METTLMSKTERRQAASFVLPVAGWHKDLYGTSRLVPSTDCSLFAAQTEGRNLILAGALT
jgi:hypothetical protein